MAKKTNRTSHVMDLLTNGASGEAPEAVSEESGGGQEKKSDVQSHTVTPAKVTVVDEGSINDRVSQEILGKLTEELDSEQSQEAETGAAETAADNPVPADPQTQETAAEAPAPADVQPQEEDAPKAEAASQEAAPAPASEAVSEPAAEVSPESAPKDASQASENAQKAPKKEPHPIIPESHFSSTTMDREYRFVNVMEQLLMRQNLESVLKQHDVCTCHRCMSDVCALALTWLPAKYVVISKDSISPLLSYYENKYKIPVFTELMKACDRVRANPHHNRPE